VKNLRETSRKEDNGYSPNSSIIEYDIVKIGTIKTLLTARFSYLTARKYLKSY